MSSEEQVTAKLRAVLDPELGVSIVDLGLIYNVEVDNHGACVITMTLTTIGCPLFGQIEKEIKENVLTIPKITDVHIDLTFDPPWTPDKMAESAKIELGLA